MAPIKFLVVAIFLCIFESATSFPTTEEKNPDDEDSYQDDEKYPAGTIKCFDYCDFPEQDLEKLLNLSQGQNRWHVSAKFIDKRYAYKHPYSETFKCTAKIVQFAKCGIHPVVKINEEVFICNRIGSVLSWKCDYLFEPKEAVVDAAKFLHIDTPSGVGIQIRYGREEYDDIISLAEFVFDGRLKSYERFINLRHAESVDC